MSRPAAGPWQSDVVPAAGTPSLEALNALRSRWDGFDAARAVAARPSRRQLLFGLGVVGAGAAVPGTSLAATLWSELAGPSKRWRQKGSAWNLLHDGEHGFRFDEADFAGHGGFSPQFKLTKEPNGDWTAELTHARFPGTEMRADFVARCRRPAGIEWLEWSFPGLAIQLEGELGRFMRGEALRGTSLGGGRAFRRDSGELQWSGRASVEFHRDWSLRLQGVKTRWSWRGEVSTARELTLCLLPGAMTTSLALHDIDGHSRAWLADFPGLGSETPKIPEWNFLLPEHDPVRVELRAVEGLRFQASEGPEWPLHGSDVMLGGGSAALLARFGETAWRHRSGGLHFAAEAENGPPTLEIALDGNRLSHWSCRPPLASGAALLGDGGGLTAEVRVYEGERASIAPPIQFVSGEPLRLAQRDTLQLPRIRIPGRDARPDPTPTPVPTATPAPRRRREEEPSRRRPDPTPTPAPTEQPSRRRPDLGDILRGGIGDRVKPTPTPEPRRRAPVIEGRPPVILDKPPVLIDPSKVRNPVQLLEPELDIVRPDDLLQLRFRLINLKIEGNKLVRSGAGAPFVIVEFAPQSFAEQTWNLGDPISKLPALRRASGLSQLAFRLSNSFTSAPLTLDTLLDWDKWIESTGNSAQHDPSTGEPETALEIPFRLLLSPKAGVWMHSIPAKGAAGRFELWHTRLGTTKAPGPLEARDSPSFAPDRRLHTVWAKPNTGSSFSTSLKPEDRADLVSLMTSSPATRYFEAENLTLSTLGATLRGQTNGSGWAVDALPPSASLSSWRHVATLGRDHYVRVVREGFLFPFGHRAAKITIVERTIESIFGRQTAVLRRREIIVVREVEKSFREAGASLQDQRRMPLRTVRLHTLETPAIQPGQAVLTPVGSKDPFLFNLSGYDEAGQKVEWSMPLIWTQRGTSGPIASIGSQSLSLSANGASQVNALVAAWNGLDVGKVKLLGQKVAFGPPQTPGDTTFAVDSFGWGARSRPLTGSNEPYFWPVMGCAELAVPALKNLAPDSGATIARLSSTFVESGLGGGANAGEVLMELVKDGATYVDAGAASPASTALALGAQTAGGLVQPALGITGLSRKLGPVGGSLATIAAGTFNPADYFKEALDKARLLGGIKLSDLLIAAGMDVSPAPQLISQIKNAAGALENAVPQEVTSKLHWETGALQKVSVFKPSGSTKLTLDATVTVKPSGAQTDVRGKLNDFQLDFFSFVTVQFIKLEFISLNGQKPDINCDLSPTQPVAFGGPLSFIQTLADIIPSDKFSDPPSLDLTPTGVTAAYTFGLPDVSAGAWGFANLAFGAALTIPFTAQPARVRFNFCERDDPLAITVYGLTGGGFCAMSLGTDGIERFEASFEIGGSLALNFGVAKGGVYIMVGIYFELRSEEKAIVLAGYVRAGGALSILGLVTLSIEMLMELAYDSGPNLVRGSVSVKVKVSVAFFSKTVSFTAHKEFEAPAAMKKAADAITALPQEPLGRLVSAPAFEPDYVHHAAVEDYWSQVCAAYV